MTDEETGRRRTNLGRGLDALFGEDDDYASLDRLRPSRLVPVEILSANPFQPRHRFDDDEMAELVDSVRQQGVLQPILVRPEPDDPSRYQIVAGERRWRAAQAAQLHEVPVVVRELDDEETLRLALIENVQRENLSPLEEAEAYQRLIRDFRHSQDDLARAVGKSRSHVANTLRLLTLPDDVRDLLEQGQLSAGHARALLASPDPGIAAQETVRLGLNVRQTEALARGGAPARPRRRAARAAPSGQPGKDPDTLALEREVSDLLGLRVAIDAIDGQRGSVTVHYQTLEQLDHLLHRLSQGRAD